MDQVMNGVRRFSHWGLWFGGALILLAAVLIGIDVLMRKFLARSIGGGDELAGYAAMIGFTTSLFIGLLSLAIPVVAALVILGLSCSVIFYILPLSLAMGEITWGTSN